MHNSNEKSYDDRNFKKFGLDVNLFVSVCSGVIVLFFIVYTLLFPDIASEQFTSIKDSVIKNFNWLYVLVINVAVVFILYLALSKYGKIRLGGEDAKPEFSDLSWYAMLFSAGIGIGIFFYGIAEPIMHLNVPASLDSGTQFNSFRLMYLHWGLHAWSIYALVAIALGFFAYNKGLPLSLRSVFYPILGDKIYGRWGDVIDILAVISVLFGLATSLGLGAGQLNAGLSYVFGVPISPVVQVTLIVVITFIATLSVVSGIGKGIKLLSELNMYVSLGLLLFILLFGPTVYIFATYFSSLGEYLRDFISLGLYIGTTTEEVTWQGSWTIFYWAWWFSWSPFVGIFIARISKGRSIKEIALGVILIPSLVIFFAMTILGATGIYLNNLYGGVIESAVAANVATSMYTMIEYLFQNKVMKIIVSLIGMFAVTIFFITSSDSGSLVVDGLTSGGKIDSPKRQRVFWATIQGLIALSVLLIGGTAALNTIQSAVIITTLPFALILLMLIYSLKVGLQSSFTKRKINEIDVLKDK